MKVIMRTLYQCLPLLIILAIIKETFKYLKVNKKGKVFNNLKEAHDHFSDIIHNNDLLMVKGSNATGLSQFSKNIKRGYFSAI